MRRALLTCVAGSMLILGGCAEPPLADLGPERTIDHPTGRLVAFWLKYDKQSDRPIVVTESYGALLVWIGGEKRFCLYDNLRKQTFSTTDYDAFLAALERLPRDIAIQRFSTCTVSRTYDMPAEQWRRLKDVMAARNQTWAISRVYGLDCEIICYCESAGFRFPE